MPKRSLEALEDYPDTTLIKSTLKDTWSRFHEWNLEDSRKTIESLRAPVARRRNHTLLDDNYPANSTTKLNESAEDTVSVFQFDEEGAIVTVSRTTFQTVRVQGLPESLITPAYESGPPISRNIMVGDDPSTLPFLPFADDAGFNWADYAGQHDAQCAWHYPRYMIDPGEAFMVVQTVRKLVERHGLTAEEIESAGVLPAPLLDSNWRRGILYQDSLVDWFQKFESGIAERNAILLPRALLAVNRLNAATDVNLGLSLFCNGLNCLVSCCTTHFDESPAPLATAPTVTSSQILDNTVQPCDRQCFLFYPPCLPTNWTTEELETLQVVVRFSPDTSPCDLAVICNKPCFESGIQMATKDDRRQRRWPAFTVATTANYTFLFVDISRSVDLAFPTTSTQSSIQMTISRSTHGTHLALMTDLVLNKPDVLVSLTMLIVNTLVVVIVHVHADGKGVSVTGQDKDETSAGQLLVPVLKFEGSAIRNCAIDARREVTFTSLRNFKSCKLTLRSPKTPIPPDARTSLSNEARRRQSR
ncbi:hypothetical protein E1B28_006672 [Marasmius oreades]|uniref:Uncharacterized protein n=1 Tax=Marasmius oreades TaxID=181124 RepID=A0A9P7UWL8_9AGAR|nr:uncharacterized protein E1B28_006672 [Marasmius oreades]KAG7095989.1 hypothetical protein E1B28_006672 [Marasmius oreades]